MKDKLNGSGRSSRRGKLSQTRFRSHWGISLSAGRRHEDLCRGRGTG